MLILRQRDRSAGRAPARLYVPGLSTVRSDPLPGSGERRTEETNAGRNRNGENASGIESNLGINPGSLVEDELK